MIHHGITIAERGSALVTVERSAEDALLVVGIERLPFSLSTVAARVRALADPGAQVREGVEAAERRAANDPRHTRTDTSIRSGETTPTRAADAVAGLVGGSVRTFVSAREARYVIDAEGLGTALWAVLGPPEDAKHWTLYTGRGQERQGLVDGLLVAMEQDRFRFAAGLAEQEPMNKALLAFRRAVRDDGLIGSELVVALLLAVIPPPLPSVYEERGMLVL